MARATERRPRAAVFATGRLTADLVVGFAAVRFAVSDTTCVVVFANAAAIAARTASPSVEAPNNCLSCFNFVSSTSTETLTLVGRMTTEARFATFDGFFSSRNSDGASARKTSTRVSVRPNRAS